MNSHFTDNWTTWIVALHACAWWQNITGEIFSYNICVKNHKFSAQASTYQALAKRLNNCTGRHNLL